MTRTRRAGLIRGHLPTEALDVVLQTTGQSAGDLSAFAIAEPEIELPAGLHVERFPHHYAHAVTAFHTSSLRDAVVIVCDRHRTPELTVWRGTDEGLRQLEFPWTGPAFASVHGQAARALGFAADGEEHRLEALAHGARRSAEPPPVSLVYHGDRLDIGSDFLTAIAGALRSNGSGPAVAHAADVAHRVQFHLGRLLVQFVDDVRKRFGGSNLCLAGGLFFNSYFTTVVAQSGVYENVFVPVNPGNAGVAVGAALGLAAREGSLSHNGPVSPFLGPEYTTDEIKTTLDNCKLSYDYVSGREAIERVATRLAQGKLVGWYHGRMEWGARALGNRSILASPIAPFVLENLNGFLKKREPYRSYSVSVCADDAARFFRGPAASDLMEYEFDVLEPELLRGLLPLSATTLRVQTVPASAGPFYTLLKAFGATTGVPILVNTSFNGFNEPIVCTPRDAVRVFYGTGLDMAVIGNFILEK